MNLLIRTIAVSTLLAMLSACSDSSSGGGGPVSGSFRGVFIASNPATATTQPFVNLDGSGAGALNSGANQGVDLLAQHIVQASDLGGVAELRIVDGGAQRRSSGQFDSSRDRLIRLQGNDSVKGIAAFADRSMVLVTRNNGRANAGRIEAYSINASNAANATPIFQLADFSGGNMGVNAPVAATSPWDLVYDDGNDRLFVLLMDGFVAVYDNFFATNPNGRNADRFFRPNDGSRDAVNLHGGVLMAGGEFVITDVGDASSNSDGRIFVLSGNFANASGNVSNSTTGVSVSTIQGADTQLGNPVDVFLVMDKIYIAEKANNAILVFDDLSQFGNRAPNQTISVSAPESGVFIANDSIDITANNDLDEAMPGFQIDAFLVSQNPGGVAAAEEGRILTIEPNLSAIRSTFTASFNGNARSIENVFVDQFRNVHVTATSAGDGSESAGTGQVLIAALAGQSSTRFGNQASLDSSLDEVDGVTGSATQLHDPKGIDIDPRSGLKFVADFNATAPAIHVFRQFQTGNVSPLFSTTDLGMSGRRPWDLDYDPVADRLFVACTDGFVVVYDLYVSQGLNTPVGPSRSFQLQYPTGSSLTQSTNFHGIIYVRSSDRLFLSDVGSASSGTDGLLCAVSGASGLNGTTSPDFAISGPLTLLGNPVDIAVARNTIYVAEKSQSRVMAFPFAALTGANEFAASQSIQLESPESIVIQSADSFHIR